MVILNFRANSIFCCCLPTGNKAIVRSFNGVFGQRKYQTNFLKFQYTMYCHERVLRRKWQKKKSFSGNSWYIGSSLIVEMSVRVSRHCVSNVQGLWRHRHSALQFVATPLRCRRPQVHVNSEPLVQPYSLLSASLIVQKYEWIHNADLSFMTSHISEYKCACYIIRNDGKCRLAWACMSGCQRLRVD